MTNVAPLNFLHVRQRLEQRLGFGDQVLHVYYPPREAGSLTSALVKTQHILSVRSAAYIKAAAFAEVQVDVQIKFPLDATAAHKAGKVARVGWPRLRLQRMLRLPGAL